MIIVKIDRTSIKKNPNAGSTRTVVASYKNIDFTINGPLPDTLIDGVNIVLTEWTLDSNCQHCTVVKGILINPDDIELLKGIKDINYTVNQEYQILDHLPEPDYFYSYENPEIPCEDCHENTLLSDISDDYDDDGNHYAICPKCEGVNTFEFKYESIAEIIQ